MMGKSNRDLNHDMAVRMLGKLGFYKESNPTLKLSERKGFVTGAADVRFIGRGVPDASGLLHGAVGGYMENKAGHDRFPFSEWTLQQRNWAKEIREKCGAEYWIFLTLKIHNDVDAKIDPKRTWLVPYPAWMAVEAALEGIQESLVYAAKAGMRLEIQEKSLDAIHMLALYELQWNSASKAWMPGISHPFHQIYVAPHNMETATDERPEPGAGIPAQRSLGVLAGGA